MKHTELKELIRQVVKEESDYQQLFKHMLDRTGKSIPDMSDAEKVKFFTAVDKANKAKSEGKLRGYNESINEDINAIETLMLIRNLEQTNKLLVQDLKTSKGLSSNKKENIKKSIAINQGLINHYKEIFKNLKNNESVKEAELTTGQKKIDVDGDGEIEGSDLAALRNKKEENINEARDAEGNEFPEMDDVKAAIKKMIQNDDVERLLRNKVVSYLQKEKRFDGAGNTNSKRLYDKAINDLLNN